MYKLQIQWPPFRIRSRYTCTRFFTSVFFFSSKAPTPDSYPNFVLDLKLNLLRYSNYLSFCIDSVNAELIFCIKLHKTYSIFWLMAQLNISWLIFLNPIFLKAPELVMYACFGLIHLLHTELTRSETPHQLSQRGVRLHVN